MEGGPPRFRQDFSCPAVLRKCGHPGAKVSRTGLSPAVAGLPRTVPLPLRFLTGRAKPRRTPTTPRTRRHAVWAPPRSLAATGGISFDFYSRWYSDGSLPSVYRRRAMLFTRMRMSSGHSGYPIRKSADHRVLAPSRGLSQLITSFIAWQLLGILRGPLFT